MFVNDNTVIYITVKKKKKPIKGKQNVHVMLQNEFWEDH